MSPGLHCEVKIEPMVWRSANRRNMGGVRTMMMMHVSLHYLPIQAQFALVCFSDATQEIVGLICSLRMIKRQYEDNSIGREYATGSYNDDLFRKRGESRDNKDSSLQEITFRESEVTGK